MKLKEEKISSKKVYECSFMSVYEDDILLPNKKESKRIYVKHSGAAAVLPITKNNEVVLVKQYRYPIKQNSIEIPAGKKDDIKESGLECVVRELEEETGYQSNEYKKIFTVHNCVGYSNEAIDLFIAKNCFKIKNPVESDDDEFLEVLTVSFQQAKQWINDGTITDGKTIIAIQALHDVV